MRLVNDSGLWTCGPDPQPVPLTAVLEVAGAVLSWTVDDPGADVHITFTDPAQADWLWRIVGENGHAEIASAIESTAADGVDLDAVATVPGALDPLRRLAVGHWLRRWWPASQRDGIAELDRALLDGEIAVLTAAAEDFFGADGTFDSDVAGLLRPHAETLNSWAHQGDPRVLELVGACAELGEDVGVAFGQPVAVASTGRRDDYALAAGPGADRRRDAIAIGVSSVPWGAVPPGVFDAAENTIDWQIEAEGSVVTAVVRTEVSGPGSPDGIVVRIRSGGIDGVGALDAAGAAVVELFEAGATAVTESAAWNHDWRQTEVAIGVDVEESAEVRDRVRDLARRRLQRPGPDAFLAEILAAESDY